MVFEYVSLVRSHAQFEQYFTDWLSVEAATISNQWGTHKAKKNTLLSKGPFLNT